ncbi:BgTH12-05645 [Blumeria graminis f. sp. triticale]|nr:BgTH12-05645 [Blumeria graminis f. sp. triticale]
MGPYMATFNRFLGFPIDAWPTYKPKIPSIFRMINVMKSTWGTLWDVIVFWQVRFMRWLTCKSPIETWYIILRDAETYEEWEEAALQLDVLTGNDLWRQNPTSKYYDYRLIHQRLQSIIIAREEEDYIQLINLLRSGLVRNLGNVTTPRLFNRAFAGTKLLIEDYITQVSEAIADVTKLSTSPNTDDNENRNICRFSSQAKLDLLHDTRQAFGRSTLVLEGGAVFGLFHLGVVKALHARGLLPRILTGTATGALIAALVGTHTEDELPKLFSGNGIDLRAFGTGGGKVRASLLKRITSYNGRFITLFKRLPILFTGGNFFDVTVLEKCMRENIGDLTFEEAYLKTKRVLNITVATTGRGGVPNLLNYLTAPNVLIWSAAVASNTPPSKSLYSRPPVLRCKDTSGEIVPWSIAADITFRPRTHTSYTERESPLTRVAELFNVNHFIVSQARPHVIPFLQSDMHGPPPLIQRGGRTPLISGLLRLIGIELDHRIHQLETMGLLPTIIRRFLITEQIPGTPVTLVPELSASDFFCFLKEPTQANLRYWILRGEKSVWPAIGALKVRCAIEIELDRGYQFTRRRKAVRLRPDSSRVDKGEGRERARERVRADSLSGKW